MTVVDFVGWSAIDHVEDFGLRVVEAHDLLGQQVLELRPQMHGVGYEAEQLVRHLTADEIMLRMTGREFLFQERAHVGA